MLSNTDRAENSAPCWNNMPSRRRTLRCPSASGVARSKPKQAHPARRRPQQAEDFPQQRGLAAAGAANQGRHITGGDGQVEVLVDDHILVAGPHPFELDGGGRSRS